MPKNWVLSDVVVDEQTFEPGKTLLPVWWGRKGQVGPQFEVDIYRVRDSFVLQILRRVFRSAPAEFVLHATLPAGISPSHPIWLSDQVQLLDDFVAYQAAVPFQLSAPGRIRSKFAFGTPSRQPEPPFVYSAAIGNAKLRADVGVSGSLGGVRVEANLVRLDMDMTFAVDPLVRVRLVTGQELARGTATYVADEVSFNERELAEFLAFDQGQLAGELERAYQGPLSWQAELEPATLFGDVGDVESAALAIDAAEPGMGYFALEYSLVEDPDVSQLSQVFALQTSRSGVTRVLTDLSRVQLNEEERGTAAAPALV